MAGHDIGSLCLAFSPDGKYVVSGGSDSRVLIFSTATSDVWTSGAGHRGEVRGVAFSPDGQLFYSAGADGTLRAWKTQGGGAKGEPLRHGERVLHFALSPDGKRAATIDYRELVIWDLQKRKPLHRIDVKKMRNASGLAFSPNGATLFGSDISKVWAWDVAAGTQKQAVDAPVGLYSVAVTRELLLVGGQDGTVTTWELPSLTPKGTIPTKQGNLYGLAVSPDGKTLVTGGNSNEIILWSLPAGVRR